MELPVRTRDSAKVPFSMSLAAQDPIVPEPERREQMAGMRGGGMLRHAAELAALVSAARIPETELGGVTEAGPIAVAHTHDIEKSLFPKTSW